ncbi:hypothetical protein PV10_04508 [Exophiala mesophila]|uniref:Uncharacterized protein n=1 Tax=Exophiala mesophila TaxID=212818 RepID=A0A0D1ZEW0_EXOME|nr:uncharacterized protein PV10_04508 [Exophiala mesophila]KIV93282.1 hypothetical protein PV10_04508 [Exophiala mesophila]
MHGSSLTLVGWTLESLSSGHLAAAPSQWRMAAHSLHRTISFKLAPLENSIFTFCLSPSGATSDFALKFSFVSKACLPRMTWNGVLLHPFLFTLAVLGPPPIRLAAKWRSRVGFM